MERLRVKYDIVYFTATEKLPYMMLTQSIRKFVSSKCVMEFKLFNLNYFYQNEHIVQNLNKNKCFSLLLDRSIDKDNIDNEVLLAVWYDPDGSDEKFHTRMDYLMVSRPQSATANGLFPSDGEDLQSLIIKECQPEECTELVGVGRDGAASIIAAIGLSFVEGNLGWVFWMWWLVH